MHLLTKIGSTGLAVHIADINGEALCKTKIDRTMWQIGDYLPKGRVICYHCQRALSKKDCLLWRDRDSIS